MIAKNAESLFMIDTQLWQMQWVAEFHLWRRWPTSGSHQLYSAFFLHKNFAFPSTPSISANFDGS